MDPYDWVVTNYVWPKNQSTISINICQRLSKIMLNSTKNEPSNSDRSSSTSDDSDLTNNFELMNANNSNKHLVYIYFIFVIVF